MFDILLVITLIQSFYFIITSLYNQITFFYKLYEYPDFLSHQQNNG